jgi:DNA-binding response OmpR family regulator
MSLYPTYGQVSPDYETIAAPLSEDRISVLFIEDDPGLAEMYRIKLELDGYQVSVVEAADIANGQGPRLHAELIFLDIRAPHWERAQILKTLRKNRALKKVPVVILSDYSWHQLKDAGISLHSREYLVLNFHLPASALVDD